MIYTTNFASLKRLPKDIIPISICGKAPEWYNGLQYKKLAPKYDFFIEWKETHDNNFYIEHFQKEVLDKLKVSDVVFNLHRISNPNMYTKLPDIALICYEPKPLDNMTFEDIIKSDKYFCHRHLVANWLNNNGFEVKEYKCE